MASTFQAADRDFSLIKILSCHKGGMNIAVFLVFTRSPLGHLCLLECVVLTLGGFYYDHLSWNNVFRNIQSLIKIENLFLFLCRRNLPLMSGAEKLSPRSPNFGVPFNAAIF